ncbi:hypothetical protein BHM03_00032569 [Ensete ventricosum]|nr:hypothetical protein BHM03_00032569 [Ensete ventricosum]
MVIHAVIRIGQPGEIDRRVFYCDFQYVVGGYPYSLSSIKDRILRSNRRQPYSLVKPFSARDKRLEVHATVGLQRVPLHRRQPYSLVKPFSTDGSKLKFTPPDTGKVGTPTCKRTPHCKYNKHGGKLQRYGKE